MGNQTLSDHEKSQVTFVHGSSSDVLSTTVARLYDGKQGRWEFTGIVGAVSIISNRIEKTHYIKIIDLKNTRCVFEQELYDSFDYQKQRDFFFTFEGDSSVFGLSFADVAEAAEFHTHLLNAKSGAKPSLSNPNTSSNKLSSTNTSSTNLKAEKKKSKGGFMSKLFGSNETQELEISAPTGFKHQSHIGWDPEKGFDIRDIPADWRKLFQNAGIKKSELKDAATAQYIVSVIGEQLATQGGTPATSGGPVAQPSRSVPPPPPTQRSNPPPPPPTKGGPPPPPPHTNRNTVSMSPPPPPPPPIATSGGPPPPPPPPMATSGGPPPPPPPVHSTGGHSSVSSGGGGRGDLLASIREGKHLKAVEESSLPVLSDLSTEGNRSLVDTLAAAMAHRRGNMREDEEEEEDDDDDDWSDY